MDSGGITPEIITLVPIIVVAILIVVSFANIALHVKKTCSPKPAQRKDLRGERSRHIHQRDISPAETITKESSPVLIRRTADTHWSLRDLEKATVSSAPLSPPKQEKKDSCLAIIPHATAGHPRRTLAQEKLLQQAETILGNGIIHLPAGKATTCLRGALQIRQMTTYKLCCLTKIAEKDLLAIADGAIPTSSSWRHKNEISQALMRLRKLRRLSNALKMAFDSLFPPQYVSLMCAPVDAEQCICMLSEENSRASRHFIKTGTSLDPTFDAVANRLTINKLEHAFTNLSDEELELIEMRYGFREGGNSYVFRDMMAAHNLSYKQVHDIESQAMRKLRDVMWRDMMWELKKQRELRDQQSVSVVHWAVPSRWKHLG